MKTSESIKNLTKALLNAQTKMGAAVKESKNPFFKSSYADLPTIMEVVKEPLNNAGIIILQPMLNRGDKNFIITTLIHAESGEFISSETEVICAKHNDPQAFGAAQTYARRFGLQAMLFIPAEDDDGNTASGRSMKITGSSENSGRVAVTTISTSPNVSSANTGNPNGTNVTTSQGIPSPGIRTGSFSKRNKQLDIPVPNTTNVPNIDGPRFE